MSTDDPQNPVNGAAPHSAGPTPEGDATREAEDESGAAEAGGGLAETASPEQVTELRRKVALLSAQLEESFARSRDGQARLKDEHERLLRTAAEFENYKRRLQKEKDDMRKFGSESLLKDFLPVADNLERALDHAEQHHPGQVIEGVKLVQKMFEAALARHGVTGFSAVGQMFDPASHEALMQAESDLAPGTVVSEMARGYRLHERLVRPAAVVVAKPRSAAAADESAGAARSDAPPAAGPDADRGEGL